jgi:hypothetical protein
MLNPALSGPGTPQRTISAVEDSGLLNSGMGGAKVLMAAFVSQGIRNAIVADGIPLASHWWLLRMKSGDRVVYWGTPESFDRFQQRGKGHAYEMGVEGFQAA